MAKRENSKKFNFLNKGLFIVLVVALVFIAVYSSPLIIKSKNDSSLLKGVLATEGDLMPECEVHRDCGAKVVNGLLTFPNCRKCVDNQCVSAAGNICVWDVTNLVCQGNIMKEVFTSYYKCDANDECTIPVNQQTLSSRDCTDPTTYPTSYPGGPFNAQCNNDLRCVQTPLGPLAYKTDAYCDFTTLGGFSCILPDGSDAGLCSSNPPAGNYSYCIPA